MFSMKFNITNFGNIKDANIELKPLTVFMGFNNTGKTYLSYLLYELLKSNSNIAFDFETNLQDKVINGLVKNKKYIIDLEEYTNKHANKIEKSINNICEMFGERILKTNQSFKDAKFDIQNIFDMKEWQKDNSITVDLYGKEIAAILDGKNIIIKTNKSITKRNIRKGSNIYKKFQERLNDFLSFSIKKGLFPGNAYFVPAERATLSQLIQSSIFNLLHIFPWVEGAGINNLPLPIMDFLTYFDFFKDKSKHFEDISNFIETNVLGGSVDIIQIKNSPAKKLIYTFEGKKIELPASSSGVKSLSSLSILLKHRLNKNDILFIDEPEITLHPKNQIKLTEAFTMAINEGLNIVVATHSPYITDHINNLILGYEAFNNNKERSIEVLRQYGISQNSLINPDMTAAYEFKENGEVIDVFNRDESFIDWETFGEYSDKLSEFGYDINQALSE